MAITHLTGRENAAKRRYQVFDQTCRDDAIESRTPIRKLTRDNMSNGSAWASISYGELICSEMTQVQHDSAIRQDFAAAPVPRNGTCNLLGNKLARDSPGTGRNEHCLNSFLRSGARKDFLWATGSATAVRKPPSPKILFSAARDGACFTHAFPPVLAVRGHCR